MAQVSPAPLFSIQTHRALTTRRNLPGLLHLASHLGLIGVFGALIAADGPFWWVWLLPQGVLLIFLFTLLHETVHRTVFSSDRLNDFVAWVCGLAVILPRDWFRYFHLAHHRHTHDPTKDPELATPKPSPWPGYLWYLTGLPTWWSHLTALIRNAAGRCEDAFVPERTRARISREARITIMIYTALVAGSLALANPILLFVWILPLMIGQPFLRLYLMAEHTGCPHVPDMFENTRTVFTTWLMRKLAWNMPFHAEHHAYPTVPYHQLPRLHKLARTRLRQTENGYHRFHINYAGGFS